MPLANIVTWMDPKSITLSESQSQNGHVLYHSTFFLFLDFLVAQTVKNWLAMRKTWVWSLGWDDPWRSAWQPTLVFLPGESPWTKEPGRLQFTGSQRIRPNEAQHSTYSLPLNNTILNCIGPLIHRFFFNKYYSTAWPVVSWIHGCRATESSVGFEHLWILVAPVGPETNPWCCSRVYCINSLEWQTTEIAGNRLLP